MKRVIAIRSDKEVDMTIEDWVRERLDYILCPTDKVTRVYIDDRLKDGTLSVRAFTEQSMAIFCRVTPAESPEECPDILLLSAYGWMRQVMGPFVRTECGNIKLMKRIEDLTEKPEFSGEA